MPETLKISPGEVRRRLERGESATVLDVRGRSAYARSGERIEGDLRAEGTRGLPGMLDRLPRDGWILAYCT
ncbi:MAG TPA: hypothetical protein VN493_07705 [Thermoanaerobaculia bacterium]|nr:hypothetical protein [Thermoanaerobaculia bacterium]